MRTHIIQGMFVRYLSLVFCLVLLSGCVGAVVGAAVDTTIEVAKVPFKAGGAAVDLILPDGNDD